MTVAELIKKLGEFPPDAEVYLADPDDGAPDEPVGKVVSVGDAFKILDTWAAKRGQPNYYRRYKENYDPQGVILS